MKVKRLSDDAIIPTRAHDTDAGLDVYTTERANIWPGKDHVFKLGWSCKIPDGWALVVKEKSGRAVKDKISIGACVIDSGYRGEVMIHIFNNSGSKLTIKKGESIAQVLLVPVWCGQPEEVNELDETERGEGRMGSTGLEAKVKELDGTSVFIEAMENSPIKNVSEDWDHERDNWKRGRNPHGPGRGPNGG